MELGAYISIIMVFVLIVFGSPTFLGFGLGMAFAAVFFLGLSPMGVTRDLFSHLQSFTLLAIPMFVFTGNLMGAGNSSMYLMEFINSLVRQIRGGLGIVIILTCGFFAAMSGSGIATAAAIGTVSHRTLVEKGYSREFTAAMIAAGGQLGPIIPPSIGMIVYCAMAELNVAYMFMGGFIPGIILMIFFCIIVWIQCARHHVPKVPPAKWHERGSAFVKAGPSLIAPLIILGGIYGGVFTPTEAGAVAAVWAFIIGIFFYKGLNSWKKVFEMSKEAAYTTANVGVLIATAVLLGAISARLGIPRTIADTINSMGLGAIGFLFVFSLLLLFLGCFMDAFAILVITVPLLLPAALSLDINPYHFGMVLLFGLGIGQLTPPLGVTLFTVAKFTNQPSAGVFKAVTPLTISFIIVMWLLVIFPKLTLILPRLLMGF